MYKINFKPDHFYVEILKQDSYESRIALLNNGSEIAVRYTNNYNQENDLTEIFPVLKDVPVFKNLSPKYTQVYSEFGNDYSCVVYLIEPKKEELSVFDELVLEVEEEIRIEKMSKVFEDFKNFVHKYPKGDVFTKLENGQMVLTTEAGGKFPFTEKTFNESFKDAIRYLNKD